MMMVFRRVSWGLLALAAGCSAPDDFRHIEPRWEVRNAPMPVPLPEAKPQPPTAKPIAPPGPSPLVVRRGDSLYAISRRSGHGVEALAAANQLRPPYTLHPGDRLRAPVARYHQVARGETGYGISRAYGVDVASLMRENQIHPPYRLVVGQQLRLPADHAAAALPAAPPVMRSAGRDGFIWPLMGVVISGFGAKPGGLHNDGVNIRAAKGAQVLAAKDGVVAYAGDGLKGFGHLILLRHGDGWVTAYAHNQLLLVRRGQNVRQGMVIARVGASGTVNQPQLHFEVRAGRRAVDPETILPKFSLSDGSGGRRGPG